jgi:hypothetical protein
MGAPCASIPGEGVTGPFEARVPCLSPPELGLTRVRHNLAEVGYIRLRLGRGNADCERT